MNETNNKIIENKDVLFFDLKIKNKENENQIFKFKNKTITLGKNEIISDIDQALIGQDLSNDKFINFEIFIENQVKIFDEILEQGKYNFSFKVIKLQKYNSREQIEISKMKETHNDKHKIKELEEIKQKLVDKIEKLEEEKQLAEKIFKSKVEEMAKNAANKVEVLKEEIKNKAKEDVDYKTKYAIQKLVEDLLSPLNNLHVAIEAGSKANDPNVSAYVKGFQMLSSQIFNTLESHGISIIQPKEGELFNPEIHQVQEIINDPTFKKDQIIKLISRGYKLHDRVLRPAIVVVAK